VVGVAVVPLNLTVLVPCVAPKFAPATVTGAPTGPDVGERLVMLGADTVGTVNGRPLLATPDTVATTLPVVAPTGTGTKMLVADQLVGVAVVPLNVTVLVPCVAPKLKGSSESAEYLTLGCRKTPRLMADSRARRCYTPAPRSNSALQATGFRWSRS
jgi:hypothetical protein